MAFGSTITITVNTVDKVLVRVNQDNYGSEYALRGSADSWNLKIRHSEDAPDRDGVVCLRHNMYLEHVTYPTSTTPMYKETCTWTMRTTKFNADTQLGYNAKGMIAYLSASTYSAVNDLIAGMN